MTEDQIRAQIREEMLSHGIPPHAADEGIDLAFHYVDQVLERLAAIGDLASDPKVALLTISLATSLAQQRLGLAEQLFRDTAAIDGLTVREFQIMDPSS